MFSVVRFGSYPECLCPLVWDIFGLEYVTLNHNWIQLAGRTKANSFKIYEVSIPLSYAIVGSDI